MQTQVFIFSFLISLFFLVTVGLTIFWLFRRSKDIFIVKNHAKGEDQVVFREDTRRNSADALSDEQKIIYAEAHKYIEQGNNLKAAKLLQSIGMLRRAVEILESAGHIQAAAEMLLKIRKPDRAGIIFARASMWKEAVNCFVEANLPEEVAKCSKLAGDYETAAIYYEKAKNNIEAGNSYEKIAKYRDAFRCFKTANLDQKAFEVLKLEISSQNRSNLKLNKAELFAIEKHVSMGEGNDQLIEILKQEDRIIPLFNDLIEKNLMASAVEVYKKSTDIISYKIIKDIRGSEEYAEKILEFLQQLADQPLLGHAFKKLKKFKAAAIAFDNAGDLDSALECYTKAEDTEQVLRINKIISEHKSPNIRRLFPKKRNQTTDRAATDYYDIFCNVALWQNLTEEQLKALWSINSATTQQAGTQILSESNTHDHIVIMLEGTIEACDTQGMYKQSYSQGNVIATGALVHPKTRKSAFHVTEDATFLKIKISEIQSMMDKDGNLARKIYQNLMRSTSSSQRKSS